MLAGFKNFDPATEKKLACHPDLPEFARAHVYKSKSATQQAVGDLIVIAYCYLLRIGEYTAGNKQTKEDEKQDSSEKKI